MSRHLHYYFCPWTNESRAWRAGALARDRGYASNIDYFGHKCTGLPNEEIHSEGQRILRLGAEPAPPGSLRLLRALSLPQWYFACLRVSRVEDATMIVAHSLAALPVCVLLARRHRLPLIYDAHELETERAGWSKSIRKIARFVEAALIRQCDHVILVNDSIRDWYCEAYKGIHSSVVRNVPNAPPEIGTSMLRQTLGLSSDVILYVYCGALGADRGLSELIEAFRELGDDRHLVMLGCGHGKEALADQAVGLANVHFHDAVPQSELVTLISGADVGIIVPKTDSLSYELGLPNKLFEYAAAGLGVITGRGPELQRFSKEYPASNCADLNIDSLKAAICAWTRDELNRLAPAIAAFTAPSWQVEQERLIEAFDLAIENRRFRSR